MKKILLGLLLLGSLTSFAQNNELCEKYKYNIESLDYQIKMNNEIPGWYKEEVLEMSILFKENPSLLKCVSLIDVFDSVSYRCPKIRLANFLLDHGADASIREEDYELDALYYGIRFYGKIFGQVSHEWMSRKSCETDVFEPSTKKDYQKLLKRLQDTGLNPERESKYGVSAKKAAIDAKLGWPLNFLK